MENNCGTCCVTCDNCFFGGKKIGSRGDINSPLVIVGESPGAQELSKGVPFVGPSGEMLAKLIPEGMDPYITNAIQCMPRQKDEKRLNEACKRCHNRLVDEIVKAPRKVILALGNGALRSLTGDYNLKITQERGKVFPSELAEHGIVACVHPAFLLRGGGSPKKFAEDVAYAIKLATEGSLGKREPVIPDYKVVSTMQDVDDMIEDLSKYDYLAADTETGGFNHREDSILCFGLCGDPKMVYVVPGYCEPGYLPAKYEGGLDNDFIEPDAYIKAVEFLGNTKSRFIWHNGKFDVKFYRHQLNVIARTDEDTMLLNYSLDETRGVHDLEQVGSDTVGMPNWKAELDKYVPKKSDSYAKIPRDVLNRYQAYDCSATLQIFNILREKVRADKCCEKLYTRTLIPASEFLTVLEMTGFQFDWVQWEKNKIRLEREVEEARAIVCEVAGYEINPASPTQVAKLLFDELRIPSKHGRSTAKEILDKLPKVPAVVAMQKFRKSAKALSTYVIGFQKHVQPNERIYSTYLLHGTPTGRLASRNPNMQNIPRDTELRGMFIPSPGHIIIDFDYSQAELRSLAELSGDQILIDIFSDPERSLHKEVAKDMYGEGYDGEQYIRAKAVNFGIAYGREAYSIAEEFEIPNVEAKRLIEAWFARFPGAYKFITNCRNAPIKRQAMVTVFGRRKRPQLVTRERLKELQNEAANFPHQSTASDLTLHSAMRLQPIFASMGAEIVNIVHDSIVVSCPNNPETIEAVKKIGVEVMMQVPIDWGIKKVPFNADCKVLDRWGK